MASQPNQLTALSTKSPKAQPRPQPAREIDAYARPSRLLLLREVAVFVNFLSGQSAVKPLAQQFAPHCDGRPIMLVPGFLSDPVSMIMLRRVLAATGYPVCDWGMGRNMGARADTLDRLGAQLTNFASRHDAPVTLIGWSLGGLFSREIAKRHPQMVREVMTLGTPFSGCPRANNAWRIYERITGHAVDNPPVKAVREEKPPVPTTAFWSAYDGVVSIGSARGQRGECDKAIEVDCGHLSFSSKPSALRAILTHLQNGY